MAYLNAPDPEWQVRLLWLAERRVQASSLAEVCCLQLQGLKSARWVADDQDRLQALVRNGGLALLVSLLGSRSPGAR